MSNSGMQTRSEYKTSLSLIGSACLPFYRQQDLKHLKTRPVVLLSISDYAISGKLRNLGPPAVRKGFLFRRLLSAASLLLIVALALTYRFKTYNYGIQ